MVSVYTLFNILYLGIWHWQTTRVMSISLLDVIKDVMPFLLSAIIVMAVTWFVTKSITSPICLLISRIIIATCLYVAIMKLTGAKILEECLKFIRKK